MDLERLFNELTHKYLDYIYICHLHCVGKPLRWGVENAYEELKRKGLDEDKLKLFAELLKIANKELVSK